MEDHIHTVVEYWPIIAFVLGSGAFAGAAIATGFVNKMITAKLYREDGTTRFIMKSDCEEMQTRCNRHVCGYLENMDKKLDKLEHHNEKMAGTIIKMVADVATLTGRLEANGNNHVAKFHVGK